jgi:hypothetical protein
LDFFFFFWIGGLGVADDLRERLLLFMALCLLALFDVNVIEEETDVVVEAVDDLL